MSQVLIAKLGWAHMDTRTLSESPVSVKECLLSYLGELPDSVLIWESYWFIAGYRHELESLGAHVAVFADDLHCHSESVRAAKALSFASCDCILSTYKDVFADFFPDVPTEKVFWVPHAASPDFHLPFNGEPNNALLVSGAMSDFYPLRQHVASLEADPGLAVVCDAHPGYHCGYDYDTDQRVGNGYAERIRSFRAAFTDGSRFNYVLAKHFEIPATGALLVADRSLRASLHALGYVDGEHYVSVTQGNVENKIRDLLEESNHEELDRIRRAGQCLVRSRHRSRDRAELIDRICGA